MASYPAVCPCTLIIADLSVDERRIHDWLVHRSASVRPETAQTMRFAARDIAVGRHRVDAACPRST
jgi:hypothetical protein